MPTVPFDAEPRGTTREIDDIVLDLATDTIFPWLLQSPDPETAMTLVEQALGDEHAQSKKGSLAITAAGLSTNPDVFITLVANGWSKADQS